MPFTVSQLGPENTKQFSWVNGQNQASCEIPCALSYKEQPFNAEIKNERLLPSLQYYFCQRPCMVH